MMKKRTQNNTTPLNNEYVRAAQRKEKQRHGKKVRLRRRLTVFALLVVLSFGVLTNFFFKQQKVLENKHEEKEQLLLELAEVDKEQVSLKRQLEKLNDDEYLAKLARQEYFLSDEGEIIFTLPKKDEKVKKKTDEKE